MRSLIAYSNLLTVVAAHGFVQNATIGSKEYDFYHPYQDPYMNPAPQRISRLINGNGPVEDLSLVDLECGGYSAEGVIGSKPAALHAPADAGSTVNLRWTGWPESHQGPILTYMARCPDEGCQNYMTGYKPVWFKIKQDGRYTYGTEWLQNEWATSPLIPAPNAGVNYTIPRCLKPGYWLVRHEIIALHSAYNYPGAQSYPGCHQLDVSGNGTVVPREGLVSFPGAYKGNDTGVLYSIYGNEKYVIPGPAVFDC